MPSWRQVRESIEKSGTEAGAAHDKFRHQYLGKLHRHTQRNAILYYSGWLQYPDDSSSAFSLNDMDISGFMATIHKLDRAKGLDLILHTPGGGIAATEALVNYLRSMFGTDIRAIVPQLALSAGTMTALACKEVVMGKHSSLGPTDPQMGGMAAHSLIQEFHQAAAQINDPNTGAGYIPLWQQIFSRVPPTLFTEAHHAITWADEMVFEWLKSGMFDGHPDAEALAKKVIENFGSHQKSLAHERHISIAKAKDWGVKVVELETDQLLQDLVLTIHHATLQTLASLGVSKLIENHNGISFIQRLDFGHLPSPP